MKLKKAIWKKNAAKQEHLALETEINAANNVEKLKTVLLKILKRLK